MCEDGDILAGKDRWQVLETNTQRIRPRFVLRIILKNY
jgi:hypothetical protein